MQTVNNGMDQRSTHSLEILDALARVGAEFAAREEEMAKIFRSRRSAASRKRSDALARAESHFAEQMEVAVADFRERVDSLRSRHGARAERIHNAHTRGIRDVMTEARRQKEKWLSDLQLRHYHAKQQLPIDLKATDTELANFYGQLAEKRNVLTTLQNRATQAFAGYLSYQRRLNPAPAEQPSPAGSDRDRLFAEFEERLGQSEQQLRRFRRSPIPLLFSILQPVILVVLLVIGAGAYAIKLGAHAAAFRTAGLLFVAALAAMFALHFLGYFMSKSTATALADSLNDAARLHDACALAGQAKYTEDRTRIQEEYDALGLEIRELWKRGDELEEEFSEDKRSKIVAQAPRSLAQNERMLKARLRQVEELRATTLAGVTSGNDTQRQQITSASEAEVAAIAEEEAAARTKLETEWKAQITSLYDLIAAMNQAAQLPAWDTALVEKWTPARDFVPAVRIGQLDVDLAKMPGGLPKQLPLPGDSHLSIPVSLALPGQGSLVLETDDPEPVKPVLNNIILRLLATMPPGKASFTIIDPIGLGQDFGGLMHLSDYEDSLINRRIWTQRDQIEERLAELNEHVEKVIQMYLRNEYATIAEYNAQAGSVSEKYHFLVIADFPAGFGETAAKRLQSIIVSGPPCGVFTFIHRDRRHPLPDGFSGEELRKNSVFLRREAGQWILSPSQAQSGAVLALDAPPAPDLAVSLVHKIGKASIDSNRVEVPFMQVAPRPDDMWTGDTTSELRVAVGRTGATKLQYLAIGKGTRQHALFAGKTGSGKSTLFHVIITNLALWCSPDQVEFYLIDFKKGVEFKCYATNSLPHARVVAIESDREFGLSVLQRVDDELKRRGDLFRKLGVQDIAGYKRAGGTEPIPRTLLIIDEFQEFFVEDDEIGQNASLLFDRIVRQGRAFGIHVLLGSQTLGGAYTLARATLGQMVIRVALQCNEADAYLIMDESNSAPRLLSRPGEGIYNDAAGAVEGNSPFQVVWLSDEERDRWLSHVSLLAAKHHDRHRGPIVFEGNAPADIRENQLLADALATKPLALPPSPRVWLGAPNSIKGPTEAVFVRQSGNHLLIAGQREEAALTMLGLSLISLAAQHPIGTARFFLLHQTVPGSADALFVERICAAIPHGVRAIGAHEIPAVMTEVAEELAARENGQSIHRDGIFLLVHGLQRFKKLRQEDDFSFSSSDSGPDPAAQFTKVITEGSSHGIHLLLTIDTYNNVSRFLSRKAQSEIEMRVVFQMSVNDSASLIDSPKASTLGLHRALLFNEQQGTLETFRPYAMPDAEWIERAAAKLRGERNV